MWKPFIPIPLSKHIRRKRFHGGACLTVYECHISKAIWYAWGGTGEFFWQVGLRVDVGGGFQSSRQCWDVWGIVKLGAVQTVMLFFLLYSIGITHVFCILILISIMEMVCRRLSTWRTVSWQCHFINTGTTSFLVQVCISPYSVNLASLQNPLKALLEYKSVKSWN